VPPDEYTEYHENVLQSYRHKTAQHTAAVQEYTEVPGEAIWWHRIQEKLLAALMQRSPRPPSWWGGRLAAPLSNYPLLSALWTSLLLFPHSKIVPQCLHLIQAGDALDISYRLRLKLVFSCMWVGVYCFCIQARGLVFHIVGYISTVVRCVVCVYAICVILH